MHREYLEARLQGFLDQGWRVEVFVRGLGQVGDDSIYSPSGQRYSIERIKANRCTFCGRDMSMVPCVHENEGEKKQAVQFHEILEEYVSKYGISGLTERQQ